MLDKARKIIFTIPEQEVIDFYNDIVGESKKSGCYREHIYAKLYRCCRYHRINKTVNHITTTNAYRIFSWLDCMSKQYGIE